MDTIEETPEFPARREHSEIERSRNQNQRSPFPAIKGIRRFFLAIRGSGEVPAIRKHDAPVIASAGTRIRKPHGIACFTAAIISTEPIGGQGLGARFDQALPIASAAVLALNARAAWAHDWVTNPSLMPVFQTLPGASFVVTGAAPVPNSALLSAGGEVRFVNGWALGARFDGEFAGRAQTYAGTGTIRYAW